MRHATLELGQVIPYLVDDLQQTINNTITASDRQTEATYDYERQGRRGGAWRGRRPPCWWWDGSRGAEAGWPRSSGPTGRPGVQPPTAPRRRRRPRTGRRHARRGGAARGRRRRCPEPRCGRGARRRRRIWPEPTRTPLPAWFACAAAAAGRFGNLGEHRGRREHEFVAALAAVWCDTTVVCSSHIFLCGCQVLFRFLCSRNDEFHLVSSTKLYYILCIFHRVSKLYTKELKTKQKQYYIQVLPAYFPKSLDRCIQNITKN